MQKKHSQIKAVFKGTSPQHFYEGETIAKFEGVSETTYWFITGRDNLKYDDKFEGEVTKLDMKLHKTILKEDFVGINRWPINIEEVQNYGFLGECIYKK